MKAFDIQKALDGADVITRDGKEVYQLTWFDCANKHCVHGVIDDWIFSWTVEGKIVTDTDEPHDKDLFMAPSIQERWAVRSGNRVVPTLFASMEDAKDIYPDAEGYHMISWEE